MPMNPIQFKCSGAHYFTLDRLNEFQGELKKRTKKDIDKIKKSIIKHGFVAPFFYFVKDGKNFVLDGHGRLQACRELISDGIFFEGAFPCVEIKIDTEDEAKEILLKINSQYGKMTKESIVEFIGDIDIPENWNIGVIVGKSGTGKTTIAKKLFGDYIYNPKYTDEPIIDNFPKNKSMEEISSILNSVGFSSIPSWLKPYSVLSNGEKMRVDLAMAIMQDQEIIIFDEFTSVVDREVAQVGSFSLQKKIRKDNKKFIAVTCHFDILEWLNPDWIFNTDKMEFELPRGRLCRPKIKIDIVETKGNWKYFSKYHYLNHDFSPIAATEYTGYINNNPCCFIAWRFTSHPKIKIKRVTRLVVLPDYQGIGIAQRLLTETAKIESKKHNKHKLDIVTSNVFFAKNIQKNKNFFLNAVHNPKKTSKSLKPSLKKTVANNRKTYSFRFCEITNGNL